MSSSFIISLNFTRTNIRIIMLSRFYIIHKARIGHKKGELNENTYWQIIVTYNNKEFTGG